MTDQPEKFIPAYEVGERIGYDGPTDPRSLRERVKSGPDSATFHPHAKEMPQEPFHPALYGHTTATTKADPGPKLPTVGLLREVVCGCGFTMTGVDEKLLADTYDNHKCFVPTFDLPAERWHQSLFDFLTAATVSAVAGATIVACWTGQMPW